jgi:hypothetical protein
MQIYKKFGKCIWLHSYMRTVSMPYRTMDNVQNYGTYNMPSSQIYGGLFMYETE